jgi:hypothetical protein
MIMMFQPLIHPELFTAATLTGAWNIPSTRASSPLATSALVSETVAPQPAAARPLIEDDERAQLKAAEQEASQLGAMRGGDLSNHELTIGIIILAVILVLILI